jgi:hypothetical protein
VPYGSGREIVFRGGRLWPYRHPSREDTGGGAIRRMGMLSSGLASLQEGSQVSVA